MRLLDSSAGAGVAPARPTARYKTTVMAEPRSNSLILRAANPAPAGAGASRWSTSLDQPHAERPNGDAGNIYVVYLKNADATKLATTLRAAMTGTSAQRAAGTAAARATHRPCRSGTPAARPPPARAARRPRPSRPAQPLDRRTDPGRPGHQLAHHHRVRAAVPPAARRHRQARRAPRPGLCRKPDRRSQRRQGGRIRHPVARPARQQGRQPDRPAGHQLRHRRQEHHQPGHAGRQPARRSRPARA